MSHTPGPWTIAWEDDDGEPFDNGVRIDSPEGPVAFDVIDCSAHVIAAAPELLAALRDCLSMLKDYYDAVSMDGDEWQAMTAARAVIAKAEGSGE